MESQDKKQLEYWYRIYGNKMYIPPYVVLIFHSFRFLTVFAQQKADTYTQSDCFLLVPASVNGKHYL